MIKHGFCFNKTLQKQAVGRIRCVALVWDPQNSFCQPNKWAMYHILMCIFLICRSLIDEVKKFLMQLLTIWVSFSANWLLQGLCLLFFFFTLCCSLICRSSLLINKYMYYKYLLSVCDLACHFMSSFTVYKSLMQPKWLFFSVFVFFKHYFWVLLNEIPPYLKVIQIVLYFSSKLQVLLFMLHFLST